MAPKAPGNCPATPALAAVPKNTSGVALYGRIAAIFTASVVTEALSTVKAMQYWPHSKVTGVRNGVIFNPASAT